SLELLSSRLSDVGERDEALALLRWARGRHPRDFWIPLRLGDLLKAGEDQDSAPGDLEERIGCLRVAVALRPDASAAHNSLGNALQAKGQLDDAIAEFRTAIDLNPNFAPIRYNLGNALKANRQLDDAIAAYRKAIEINPRFAEAHHNLASTLKAKR